MNEPALRASKANSAVLQTDLLHIFWLVCDETNYINGGSILFKCDSKPWQCDSQQACKRAVS